ncbi:tRNA (guanosine(37)-N1)-methyltransferase TrmD [Domibacillus epiphyticus]|uniref:tRNA (guanine-N(1)-)-methyltransferase n=1 Tax=Domibacillus epiphyticus TaxID=1714355 RepID=A0A1V2AC75_9BACI|nr:tRNA (guanosine(37)-N1)-methyltransferase TrmD [Domibacillus epiphyticus]OMP68579.1 tRNA (guanosine(37)-N1)-methyltransferase TrmD [Domibacillus epiphyticus]
MKIDVLTLFPEMFHGVFSSSIMKKAADKEKVSFRTVNFRDYAEGKHKVVDDYPYGGGAGMVLKPQPLFDAVDALKEEAAAAPRIILMCPQGERFTQRKAEEFAQEEHLIFLCGHYEGYDERVRTHLVTDEISIGDYVLTGGELGAMVVADSVVRLLPGVLGNDDSAVQDSFSSGMLEHPHYTRPADFRGMKVPDVLTSGNHRHIEEWRREQSLKRTWERRPDLFETISLTEKETQLIESWKKNK